MTIGKMAEMARAETDFQRGTISMVCNSRRRFVGSLAALGTAAFVDPVFPFRAASVPPVTGYAYNPDFTAFSNDGAEAWQRAKWINERLVNTGVVADTAPIAPYADPMEYIKKIHTQSHIDLINGYPAGGGGSLTIGQAAQTAVGCVLGAVDAVCSGNVKNAFCCIRPPGHHARNDGELGYCCYANVVIAARFAREKFNIRRILIVDWDYHQGNGTLDHICGDNDILFFETYYQIVAAPDCSDFQWFLGPDYVFADDARRINVRMPFDSSNDDFIRVFEEKLVPAAQRFQPELVLISCGFDLKKYDSLGSFNVTANGVSRLTRIVRQIADTHAGGRLVSLLEGGYADSQPDPAFPGTDPTFSGLAQCAENHIKTLMTGEEQLETPFFSGSIVKSMRSNAAPHGPVWRDGRIVGLAPDGGPYRITLCDCTGRVVRWLLVPGPEADLATGEIAAGRYIASIQGRLKTISLPVIR
jgi:acetoin utilization deacetylase AcuC-like enzyme